MASTCKLSDNRPDEGALSADATSVGSAAASVLAQNPLLHKASSRSSIENGVPTITLSARGHPDQDPGVRSSPLDRCGVVSEDPTKIPLDRERPPGFAASAGAHSPASATVSTP